MFVLFRSCLNLNGCLSELVCLTFLYVRFLFLICNLIVKGIHETSLGRIVAMV